MWVSKKVYAILAQNDEDLMHRVTEASEEEGKKLLDDFFGKHFSKIEEESRDRRYEELPKRFLGTSGIWKYGEEEIEQAKNNLRKITGSDKFTKENIQRFFDISLVKQNEYLKSKQATNKINTPERQALRQKMIAEEFEDQEGKRDIKHDKIALISLGDAGTGKSSSGGNYFLKKYGAYEIDPDNMKNRIPEYQNDTNMVMMVHDESGDLADKMLDTSINEGANVFIPKTGKKIESIKSIYDKLKSKGYKVFMSLIDLDKEENILRTEARGLITGRYTNPEIIKSSYGKNYQVFEKMKDFVDGWEYYYNGNKEESWGEEL